jgi:hypothetical protein
VIFVSRTLVEQAAAEILNGGPLHVHENYTAIDPVIRQLGLSAQHTLLASGGGMSALYLTSLAHVLAMHLVQHYGVTRSRSDPLARLLGMCCVGRSSSC